MKLLFLLLWKTIQIFGQGSTENQNVTISYQVEYVTLLILTNNPHTKPIIHHYEHIYEKSKICSKSPRFTVLFTLARVFLYQRTFFYYQEVSLEDN